jgi:hypothetical protein
VGDNIPPFVQPGMKPGSNQKGKIIFTQSNKDTKKKFFN